MRANYARHGLFHVSCAALVAICAATAACGGKSPTSPTPPQTPTPPVGSAQTIVRLVDAITGGGIAGVSGTINSQASAPSDAGGQSVVWAQQSGQYPVTFSGAATLARTTSIKVPSAETRVSLIPASFDLAAFDQMFRSSGRFLRWTSAPPLVILTRAVQYPGTTSASAATVLPDELTADELQALARDLSDGFVALTDQQLGGFSSVTFETPAVGSQVNVMRTGFILVARSRGLTLGTGYWGYSRWASNASGVVVGGNCMLDEDFDGGPSLYRRSLRMHELGHALGYNHVSPNVRASVMNQAANIEPNAWDLQAVHIAFQRAPGNTTPDVDPGSFSLNLRTGAVTWSPPIF